MDREEFPNCCGISVITGLHGSAEEIWDDELNNGYGTYRPRTKADDVQQLQESLLECKDSSEGLVVAVTNRERGQLRTAKLLKKFGFKALRKFYNPRHRSTLTMWELNVGKLTRAQIKAKAKKLCAQTAKR